MALSPADFYAYSRATGTPYPEDAEERARVAPDVLDFRRNQLKAPSREEDQGFNLTNALGVGAALAGVAGGAYGLHRALAPKIRELQVSRAEPLQKATVERAEQAAQTGDFGNVGSLVRDLTPKPSAQPPAPVNRRQPLEGQFSSVPRRQPGSFAELSDIENEINAEIKLDEFLNDMREEQRQIDAENKFQARNVQGMESKDKAGAKNMLAEFRRENQTKEFSPRSYVESTGAVEPVEDLTGIQEQQRDFVVQQQVEAVDSGLDQTVDKAVVIPKQRDVTAFESFSQRADQVSSEAQAQRAAAEALSAQRSRAPQNARMLQSLGPKQGLTQDEIFHRISASAGEYRPGSMDKLTELDVAALLDPTVPTEAVKDLLGTTLAVRGGRVGRNLDYEVMAEGGGMTERKSTVDIVGGEYGSDVYAYNPRTGQFEIDTSPDLEDLNLSSGRASDYETNAADYGDVEGPGGFVSTKGFKETTKGGSTIIPGQVTETSGRYVGSQRQEREIDRVIPARETVEGDPAAGWVFDENGKAYLVGTGTRLKETRTNVAGKPIRVMGPTGRVRAPGSYQGQISVDDPSYDPASGGKLHGRIQPATAEPSTSISTQPVTDFMNAGERLIQDQKGNWFINEAKTKIVGEEPLRGYVGSDPNIRDLSFNRDELNGVLKNGAEAWAAKGGGDALERQIFLIQHLDSYLKTQKQITLPVLQQKKGRLLPAAFSFINDIQPGIKETNIFVKPAKVNAEGRPLMHRETFKSGSVRETPIVHPDYIEMEAVPLPGEYKVSGAGGVDVRDIDETVDERARTYFAPLLETASQRKVMALGQATGVPAEKMVAVTTTPVGRELSKLRSEIETQPVGFRVKSPGSFARTQNPYTGAAAAAMGPASRVSGGNYQYTDQQLRVHLEPISQRQLDNRNQFALTANLTPGGRVVRGGLNLGQGLGAIPAGLGTLSESQTVSRYGASGSQLQDLGNRLMAQAAYKRGQQPGPTAQNVPTSQNKIPTATPEAPVYGPSRPPVQGPRMGLNTPGLGVDTNTEMAGYARRSSAIPETIGSIQARNDAVARHFGNYISAAAKQMEGPASIQGVKLKGVGQNALRPYQAPSEGMIQQLMRAALRR